MENTATESMPARIKSGLIAVVVGTVVLLFNFHGLLRNYVTQRFDIQSFPADVLINLSLIPKHLLSSLGPNDADVLYAAMSFSLVAMTGFVVLLLVLGVARRDISIPGAGLAGLAAGSGFLALVSWTLLLVWLIVSTIFAILRWVLQAVASIISWLINALAFLGPYVGVLLLLLAMAGAAIALWNWLGPKVLAAIAVALALLYVAFPWLRAVWAWVYDVLLRPIILFLAQVLGWILGVVFWILKAAVILGIAVLAICFCLGFVGSLGYLLIDQLRTAWNCGGTKKGVTLGSFSLGLAFALIMLVAGGQELNGSMPTATPPLQSGPASKTVPKRPSKKTQKRASRAREKAKLSVPITPPAPPKETAAHAVDRAWRHQAILGRDVSVTQVFTRILPQVIQNWASGAFQSASAPIFDSLIFAVTVLLSVCSLMRGLVRWQQFTPTVRFYSKDLIALAGLPLLLIVLVLGADPDNQ